MDAEFIFQVTEEELAQFPEEGNQSDRRNKINRNHKQGLEIEGQNKSRNPTEKQDKEDNRGKDTFTIRS